MSSCYDCIWCSTGWQDERGAGFCYSENDYVDPDGHCVHWQASLRDESLNDPPERLLVEQVAMLDREVED